MDVIDVELFLTIVKSNSITRASEIMHFSQSTMSYRLKMLEKEIGTQLFNRRKGVRTYELTYHGELFVPIAEQWLRINQATQDLKGYPDRMLAIGAVDSISSSVLSDVYFNMTKQQPPVRLKILTGSSLEIYNLLEHGDIDIGFIADRSDRKNIVTVPAFEQKYYVVRYCKKPSSTIKITPKELDPNFEIYIYWGGDYEQWHKQTWGSTTPYFLWIDTVALLRMFLTDERYWAIIPDSLLQRIVAGHQDIQVYELDLPQAYSRICYMIKSKQPKMSRLESIKIFEDVLKNTTMNLIK